MIFFFIDISLHSSIASVISWSVIEIQFISVLEICLIKSLGVIFPSEIEVCKWRSLVIFHLGNFGYTNKLYLLSGSLK